MDQLGIFSKNERVKQLTTIFGLLLEVFKDLENVTTDFGTFTTNSTDDAMSAFKVNIYKKRVIKLKV